jgi:hypothetical protein
MDKGQIYAKRLICLVKINKDLESVRTITQTKKKADEASEECDIKYIAKIKQLQIGLDELQKLL